MSRTTMQAVIDDGDSSWVITDGPGLPECFRGTAANDFAAISAIAQFVERLGVKPMTSADVVPMYDDPMERKRRKMGTSNSTWPPNPLVPGVHTIIPLLKITCPSATATAVKTNDPSAATAIAALNKAAPGSWVVVAAP